MDKAFDNMIVGTVCQVCGEYFDDVVNGDDPPGHARACERCKAMDKMVQAVPKPDRKTFDASIEFGNQTIDAYQKLIALQQVQLATQRTLEAAQHECSELRHTLHYSKLQCTSISERDVIELVLVVRDAVPIILPILESSGSGKAMFAFGEMQGVADRFPQDLKKGTL